jgi:hypothetical protein
MVISEGERGIPGGAKSKSLQYLCLVVTTTVLPMILKFIS